MLQEVFPHFTLRPKHYYIEHYPEIIYCFGPLVYHYTMRFEGKHSFFLSVLFVTHKTLRMC